MDISSTLSADSGVVTWTAKFAATNKSNPMLTPIMAVGLSTVKKRAAMSKWMIVNPRTQYPVPFNP